MKENRPLYLRHLAWFPVGWAMFAACFGLAEPKVAQPCLAGVLLLLFLAFVLSFLLE